MISFLAQRLMFALLLVLVVSSTSLLLARLAPGDVTAQLGPFASSTEVADVRARFGLDRSPAAQWIGWFTRASRFDFGDSFLYNRPVRGLVVRAAANTAVLAVAALAVATLLGIPFGIVSGSRQGAGAALIRAVSLVCLSVPPLLTSLLLVFIAASTRWLPTGGMTSAGAIDLVGAAWFADVAQHLPLPVLALALPIAATFERLQSQSITETLHQPFTMAATARGVSPRGVVWRHAWRVSLRPVCGVLRAGHRCAPVGILRRGIRDRVARPRPVDVRGIACARHLSRSRMRGDGRFVPGDRQRHRRSSAGCRGSSCA